MTSPVDQICTEIDRRLEGSGLAFALVVWVPGQADRVESVGLACQPGCEPEATTALRCVADHVDTLARRDAR